MISTAGVIFEFQGSFESKADESILLEDRILDGDSEVGQASEYPPRILSPFAKNRERKLGDESVEFSLRRDFAPDEATGRRFPGCKPAGTSYPQQETASPNIARDASFFDSHSQRTQPRRYLLTSKWFSKFGTALFLFAILGIFFTFGPILKVELNYRISQLVERGRGLKPDAGFAMLLNEAQVYAAEEVPDPNFSLIIPKIQAIARVVPNVNAEIESEYMEALKLGIAHARGTQFPGNTGNIYLFAHSTDNPLNVFRYNAVFFLLKEMEPGDEIKVYFAGVKHRYFVTEKKIIDANDLTYFTANNADGVEQLVLQTCWPPGTTIKRLVVLARKKMDG